MNAAAALAAALPFPVETASPAFPLMERDW